jgi:DNA-directed RNA polymerase II subunit RPB2
MSNHNVPPSYDPWILVRDRLSADGLVRSQIDGYDDFVDNILPQIIAGPSSSLSHDVPSRRIRAEVHFGNVCIEPSPTFTEADGFATHMTPFEATTRGLTYASKVTSDVTYIETSFAGEAGDPFVEEIGRFEQVSQQVLLMALPTMVMSKACALHRSGFDPRVKQCAVDPGGYFVINGNRKVLVGQQKLRNNRCFVWDQGEGRRNRFQAEVRSIAHGKWRSTSTIKVNCVQGPPMDIIVLIPWIVRGSSLLDVQLAGVFRALGVDTVEEMVDVSFPPYHMKATGDDSRVSLLARRILCTVLSRQELGVLDRQGVMTWIRTQCSSSSNPVHVFRNEVFPHVGMDDDPSTLRRKALFLGVVARRCATAMAASSIQGPERPPCLPVDDRDSYTNKRIDGPGPLLATVVRILWRKQLKDFGKRVDASVDAGKRRGIRHLFNSLRITSGLNYHFATGNWSTTKGVNCGIAQLQTTMNPLGAISHATRVSVPIARETKCSTPRLLAPTTWGIDCCSESPEGQSCGLIKTPCLFTRVTRDTDRDAVVPHLVRVGVIEAIRSCPDQYPVYANGCPVGLVPHDMDPYTCATQLRNMRRDGALPRDASILSVAGEGVLLYFDGGRVIRPVLLLERLTADNLCSWDAAASCGAIEYLDKEEEENWAIVAATAEEANGGLRRGYTHCEVEPGCAIFGATVATIPFPDFSQAPRVIYQAAMGKQAVQWPGTDWQWRFNEPNMCVLDAPQRALVSTEVGRSPVLDMLSGGICPIVAVLSLNGYNIEDSLIVSRGCVERGMGRITMYSTFRETLSPSSTEEETFERPSERIAGRKAYWNYSKLDADGFPAIGTEICKNDVIIGKTAVAVEYGKDGLQVVHKRCQSVVWKKQSVGRVDAVVQSLSRTGTCTAVVRIRVHRAPVAGDKFSSRHGQKGTVGLIVPDEDMPFCAQSGIRPDIVVNPHAFPSRMTIGHLVEMLLGKACAMSGKLGDGTAFKGHTVHSVREELRRLGMSPSGKEAMICGKTGEPLGRPVFIAPILYQRLKHMVADKVHARAKGPRAIMTHQPMEGRSREGGLRFGGMERNAFVAHGASGAIVDRLTDNSDRYEIWVCNRCGLVSDPPRSTAFGPVARTSAWCRPCKSSNGCKKVVTSYSYKLLWQELLSCGVALRMRLCPVDQTEVQEEERWEIACVEFGIVSPEEQVSLSATEVSSMSLYARGNACDRGFNSMFLGTTSMVKCCKTCRRDAKTCPGHFGHFPLACPVYHPGFIDYIVKALRCVCFWCSALLGQAAPLPTNEEGGVEDDEESRADADDENPRNDEMAKEILTSMSISCRASNAVCPACGGAQPQYSREPMDVSTSWDDTALAAMDEEERSVATNMFTAALANRILCHIPDKDLSKMGFPNASRSHPSWMVLKHMTVPPNCVRPSVAAMDGSRVRGQNELTLKLIDVKKACIALKTAKEAQATNAPRKGKGSRPPPSLRTLEDAIQMCVFAYYDRADANKKNVADILSTTSAMRRNRNGGGSQTTGLYKRFKGKQGRLRKDCVGKRVDFSARTVIGGDPSLDIWQIRVPLCVALTLTVPVRVTRYNVDRLRAAVRAGPGVTGGAKRLVSPSGREISVTMAPDKDTLIRQLDIGWIVHRCMQDDDPIMFNRQPTLHRESFMGFRARILKTNPGHRRRFI